MRPRKSRLVRSSPSARFYKPRGVPLCELQIVALKDEEWEAIRLADYERHDQETAAQQMGISRPTFSRVLASARAAVAKALAEGAALQIGGGDFQRCCGPAVKM
jgi:Predicted DNA-binding proteins